MTEIPAKGHTEVVDAAAAPTCTETGLTEGKHCSVCNEVLVAQTVVPAKGHSYGEWIVDTDPTCTEAGAKHKVCSVCNDEVSETITKLGHDWAEDFTVDKEATCTEAGSKSKHCSRCSEKSEVTEIPARGDHEYEAGWTIDIEATCDHSGWKSHHCAYCDSTTARPEYEADGVEIPKLAHSVSNWTEIKAPTCTLAGEKTGTCDNCGKTVTETVARLGHNWGTWVRTEDSTCTVKGSETRTCDLCGETQTRELPLLEHHIVSIPGFAATCEEPGKTDGAYCDVCGLVTQSQTEIPAKGHVDANDDGKCDSCGCDYDGKCKCICHNDSLWSKIVRFIYTLFSKIFRKRFACCEDMVFWGGEIKDLT